jgi:hypothetical protein
VSVVVGGKIVVTSDIPDPDFRGALFYDPEIDVWSKSEIRCRIPYCGGAGVTVGVYVPQKIYVLGMLLSVYGLNRVYDPLRDSWSDGKCMPMVRLNFGVAVVDDVLHAIGGCYKSQVASARNEQYIPIGYQPTPIASKPAESSKPTESHTLEPDDSSKTFLIYITVTVSAVLIAVVVIVALFLYPKKARSRY